VDSGSIVTTTGLAIFQFISVKWSSEQERSRLHPDHLVSEPNTRGDGPFADPGIRDRYIAAHSGGATHRFSSLPSFRACA